MNDPDGFLSSQRVVILGLGLMGGSLALALRGRVAELMAMDSDPATRDLAVERRIVDRITSDPEAIVPHADVIILAAPVRVILEHIQLLGYLAVHSQRVSESRGSGSVIVLDLGSTKQAVTEAMDLLPEEFDPIGGHPMCGKETSGLANADAEIYRGAPFAFTPLVRTSPRARACAEALAKVLGAHPLWIDPVTHDRWVAATSHLPYLLASILAGVTPLDVAPLVGPGFRSTSRLAASSRAMMLDVLRTNHQAVLDALRRFQTQAATVEGLLAEADFEELSVILADACERHQALVGPHS